MKRTAGGATLRLVDGCSAGLPRDEFFSGQITHMAMFVYSTGGEPVGFVYETFLHDLTGTPLGRIIGSRVHRLDGAYVGEWFKESVVDRPMGRPRALPPIAAPAPQRSPGRGTRRRIVVDYGYPDAFHLLYDPATAEAAE